MVALFSALIGPYFVNWTDYRADFEREASRLLGQPVRVNGTAQARLIPFPSITFQDVQVGGAADAEGPSIRVRKFAMDAELAPFLSGNIRIFDMRVEGADAHVTMDETGAVAWDWALGTQMAGTDIEIENLIVTDSRLRISQPAQGRDIDVLDINGTIAADSLRGPWLAEGALLFAGARYQGTVSTGLFSGAESGRVRFDFEPENKAYRLKTNGRIEAGADGVAYVGDIDFASSLTLSESNPEGLSIRARGPFKMDQNAGIVTPLRIEIGDLADPFVAEGSGSILLGDAPRFALALDGQQINLDVMLGKGDRAAPTDAGGNMLGRLLGQIKPMLRSFVQPSMGGDVTLNIPAIVYDEETFRNVTLAVAPQNGDWAIKRLDGDLPGRTRLEASGLLLMGDDLAFDGDVLVASRQPSGLAEWLTGKVDDDIRALPALGFSSRMRLSETRQNFRSLNLQLGEDTILGLIDREAVAGVTPRLDLRLEGETLNIDALEALGQLVLDISGGKQNNHSLDIRLNAQRLLGYGAEARDVLADFKINQNKIEIDTLSLGDVMGAKLIGQGAFSNIYTTPNGAFSFVVEGDDLAPLAGLLRRLSGSHAFFVGLEERAILDENFLTDGRLSFEGKSTITADGFELNAAINGRFGGTELLGDITAKGADIATADGMVSLRAGNERGERLLTLLGVPSLPLETIGPLDMRFEALGGLSSGATVDFALISPLVSDEYLRFEGIVRRADRGLKTEGRLDINLLDADPYIAAMGLELPGTGLGSGLTLNSNTVLTSEVLAMSAILGRIGGADLAGDISLSTQNLRPKVTGNLSLSDLDLALFADALWGQGYRFAATLDGGSLLQSNADFAAGISSNVDFDVSLKAQHLYFDDVISTYDASLQLILDAVGGSLENVDAALRGPTGEGRLKATIFAQNDNGNLILNGNFDVENASAKLFLSAVAAVDVVDGALDMVGTFASRGNSSKMFIASLTGSGTASLKEGRLLGINDRGFADLMAQSDGNREGLSGEAISSLINRQSFRDDLALPDVSIGYSIANGRLRLPPLSLKTEKGLLVADIAASIPDDQINVQASLQFDAGDAAQSGSIPSVDMIYEGAIDDATFTVSTQPLTQFLQQRALEREQMRVAAAQMALLERQRLRREARYFNYLGKQREQAAQEAEAARLRAQQAEEQARQDALNKAAAEQAIKDAATQEKRRNDTVKTIIENARKAPQTPGLQPPRLLNVLPETQF